MIGGLGVVHGHPQRFPCAAPRLAASRSLAGVTVARSPVLTHAGWPEDGTLAGPAESRTLPGSKSDAVAGPRPSWAGSLGPSRLLAQRAGDRPRERQAARAGTGSADLALGGAARRPVSSGRAVAGARRPIRSAFTEFVDAPRASSSPIMTCGDEVPPAPDTRRGRSSRCRSAGAPPAPSWWKVRRSGAQARTGIKGSTYQR